MTDYYSCTNGHAPIKYYEQPCQLCTMRRHIKAAQELLAPLCLNLTRKGTEGVYERVMLRLEAAVNLAGQREPDLHPAEDALSIGRIAKP